VVEIARTHSLQPKGSTRLPKPGYGVQEGVSGLGAGIVGVFQDERIIEVMKIPKSHEPLLIMPVGNRG
jgi:hypothetical protein